MLRNNRQRVGIVITAAPIATMLTRNPLHLQEFLVGWGNKSDIALLLAISHPVGQNCHTVLDVAHDNDTFPGHIQ